jgi:molybdate transport system substrate-binding protein
MKCTKKRISIVLSVLFLAIFLLIFLLNSYTRPQKVNLTISAAMSMTDAMTQITKLYKKEKSNVTLTFNYASSGALQKQIEQGSPVDVFISAATKQMDALKSGNLLVNATIKNFENLSSKKIKKIALGEPASVPAGQYAAQVMEYYGILDLVSAKAVYAKDIREVLTWVESGNADAGVVYRTDALISKNVKIVAMAPGETHTPVSYPCAVIKASKNVSAATDFLKFLSTSKAKSVLKKNGFKTN